VYLAAQLAQDDDHLDLRDVLVPQAVVRQRGAREHVAADGDACVMAGLRLLTVCCGAFAMQSQALKARMRRISTSVMH